MCVRQGKPSDLFSGLEKHKPEDDQGRKKMKKIEPQLLPMKRRWSRKEGRKPPARKRDAKTGRGKKERKGEL